jgi:hypothetical protein
MENLIPADRRIKGFAGLIRAVFAQPFQKPTLRFAQLGGGFRKRQ